MPQPIGSTLREARIRRQLDLPAVEAETKIRVRYLRALENEEWDVLPGGAYTRSFIRTYASHLGLDGERLADEYRRVYETPPGERQAGAEQPVRGPGPVGVGERRRRLSPGILTAAVAILLIGVLVAIGIAGGGSEEDAGNARPALRDDGARDGGERSGEGRSRLTLRLAAEAEVWICLVDARGRELLDGRTLAAGEVQGPFRSRLFTVTLGNGAVGLEVDGRPVGPEPTPNPVGLRITRDGAEPLPEEERPTCT